jgi:glycosyltransferase involved in cell wall biosynthesis
VTTIHSFHSIEFSPLGASQRCHKLVANNLKLSRNLIFVSHYLEKECTQLFGDDYTAERWVIHNPTDVSRYHPVAKDEARRSLGLPKGVSTLLFVGNLITRKGVYWLLEAVEILREKLQPMRVIICGNGPERERIEDFVAKNGLQDIVWLEGKKDPHELSSYYSAADLFVMPSFSESFGLVYIEAMLWGIPIIAANTTAIPEVISSEDYGILVSPADPKALAGAIERGLGKKWNREKIIEYARSFSWEKRIKEFEEVYERTKLDST